MNENSFTTWDDLSAVGDHTTLFQVTSEFQYRTTKAFSFPVTTVWVVKRRQHPARSYSAPRPAPQRAGHRRSGSDKYLSELLHDAIKGNGMGNEMASMLVD